ncbi:MAG: TRAP transporter small permease [Sedimentisphaerales bacterium]|nr:TRAP transporter small permease [Sedimentisphaerales bacterium]
MRIESLSRIELFLQKALMAVSAFFLLAMVGITCADILLRLFYQPLPGVFELMGLSGALVAACALGYTQRKKDHLAVDILTNMFPMPIQKGLDIFNRAICMLFCAAAAWQIAKLATTLMKMGELTETLRIIYYPFTYGVAAGFGLLTFVFFIELLKTLSGYPEESP